MDSMDDLFVDGQIYLDLIEGDYVVEYEPEECYTYDSRKFYQYPSKDKMDTGTLVVTVGTNEIYYLVKFDDWINEDNVRPDSDNIDLLEDIKKEEVASMKDYNIDEGWKKFSKTYKIDINTPYFRYDDKNCPWDSDEIEECEDQIMISLQFNIAKNGSVAPETVKTEYSIAIKDLYQLYSRILDYIKISPSDNDFDTPIVFSREIIMEKCAEIGNAIDSFVKEQAKENGNNVNTDQMQYSLILSKRFLEDNLRYKNR